MSLSQLTSNEESDTLTKCQALICKHVPEEKRNQNPGQEFSILTGSRYLHPDKYPKAENTKWTQVFQEFNQLCLANSSLSQEQKRRKFVCSNKRQRRPPLKSVQDLRNKTPETIQDILLHTPREQLVDIILPVWQSGSNLPVSSFWMPLFKVYGGNETVMSDFLRRVMENLSSEQQEIVVYDVWTGNYYESVPWLRTCIARAIQTLREDDKPFLFRILVTLLYKLQAIRFKPSHDDVKGLVHAILGYEDGKIPVETFRTLFRDVVVYQTDHPLSVSTYELKRLLAQLNEIWVLEPHAFQVLKEMYRSSRYEQATIIKETVLHRVNRAQKQELVSYFFNHLDTNVQTQSAWTCLVNLVNNDHKELFPMLFIVSERRRDMLRFFVSLLDKTLVQDAIAYMKDHSLTPPEDITKGSKHYALTTLPLSPDRIESYIHMLQTLKRLKLLPEHAFNMTWHVALAGRDAGLAFSLFLENHLLLNEQQGTHKITPIQVLNEALKHDRGDVIRKVYSLTSQEFRMDTNKLKGLVIQLMKRDRWNAIHALFDHSEFPEDVWTHADVRAYLDNTQNPNSRIEHLKEKLTKRANK